MTSKAISYTQTKIEIDQPLQVKGMSIQELVTKNMNEGKNMVEFSLEGQHEKSPSILVVNLKE